MKSYSLRTLIFLALCCDLGLFAKKIISPVANLITDALHIPGGIGTSFSLMFLVIAAVLVQRFGCATIMGVIQSILAFTFGMVGSMGALSVVGYVIPGLTIDLIQRMTRTMPLTLSMRMILMNAAAAPCAAFVANCIVFRLRGVVLLLYLCVSVISGTICGFWGARIAQRVAPVIGQNLTENQTQESNIDRSLSMKSRKRMLVIPIALLLFIILVVLHLSTRVSPHTGFIIVEHGAEKTEFSIDQLETSLVSGTVFNGKGEKKTIEGPGVQLSSLLNKAGIVSFQTVTVIAEDEYNAVVTAAEVLETDRVNLIIQDDGSVRLIVFGDSDSRRNVSDVARLVIS